MFPLVPHLGNSVILMYTSSEVRLRKIDVSISQSLRLGGSRRQVEDDYHSDAKESI